MTKLLLNALLLAFTFLSAQIKPQNIQQPVTNQSINFIENKGQVCDQNGELRSDVLLSGSVNQLVFHIRTSGISYQLYHAGKQLTKLNLNKNFKQQKEIVDQQIIYRVDCNWLNISSNVQIETNLPSPGFDNFYSQHCGDGIINVQSFQVVKLKNLYDGIDLCYYSKDGTLKYDYIVQPHTDYKQIKSEVVGATDVRLGKLGELIITTPLGDIVEQPPLVFQKGRTLKSRWLLTKNKVSFEIEDADPNEVIIIDPAIGLRLWGTYYGGSGTNDKITSCKTDQLGNTYVTGNTNTSLSTVIATSGSHQTNLGGSVDAFITKFDANGVRLWGTYYGGSNDDYSTSCSVSASGEIYIAGWTNSANAIATTGSHQQSPGGSNDGFIVKFNSNGVRQWATYYGGSGSDYINSCATDGSGNLFITGTSMFSGSVIATPGSFQTMESGAGDLFLVKFSSSGVRQWGTYYGDYTSENVSSCATDGQGNVYLLGDVDINSSLLTTPGSHQSNFAGVRDALLVKFNGAGQRLWATYYGGNGDDRGYACSVDHFDNVYIGGYSTSTVGISTSGVHQSVYGGSTDGFLTKFDSTGVRLWGTYYGGDQNDVIRGCDIDSIGYVYITGNTNSTVSISSGNAFQLLYAGNSDAFLARFTDNGIGEWGTYYGGNSQDMGSSVSSGVNNNVFISGFTSSTVGISTPSSHQNNFGGGTDGFLAKFHNCVSPSSPLDVTSNSNKIVCNNSSATLSASSIGTINWFTSPTASTSIATGSIYTTPSLSVGTYTYYAEANTCTVSVLRTPIIVTVIANPTITVNSGSVCSGSLFVINPSGATSYTFSTGTSTVTPSSTTQFTVTGENAFGCNSAPAIGTISVSPSPTVSVSSSSAIVCSGESATLTATGANSYSWSTGQLNSTIVITPTTTSNYTVVGVNSNNCQHTIAFTQSVSTCNRIIEIGSEWNVHIHPNPTNSKIIIETDLPEFQVIVMDVLGTVVKREMGEFDCTLDISEQSAGVYIIKLQYKARHEVYRVLKY